MIEKKPLTTEDCDLAIELAQRLGNDDHIQYWEDLKRKLELEKKNA